MQLLIIEDNPDTTTVLQHLLPFVLEGAIEQTRFAASLQEAESIMCSFNPVAVLFDINLPDGKGFVFAEKWQASHRSFLCMSAFPKEQYFDDVLRCGVRAYIEKPLSIEHLENALQKALIHCRQYQQNIQLLDDIAKWGAEKIIELNTAKRKLEYYQTKELLAKQEQILEHFTPQELLDISQSQHLSSKAQSARLCVTLKSGESVLVDAHDIVLAEAEKNYVLLHCTSRQEPLRERATLCDYEKRLQNQGFVRVHRSFLVQMGHVEKLTSDFAVLKSGRSVPIASKRLSDVRAAFKRLF